MNDRTNRPLILVSSQTYAMKGRDILARQGIRAFVERIPPTGGGGCGFGVYVPGSPDRADMAERILQENGIKILGRTSQGPSK